MLYTFPIKNVGDVKIYCKPEFLCTFEKLFSYCLKNTAFRKALSSIVARYPNFSIKFVNTKLFANGQWSPNDHQIKIKAKLGFYDLVDALTFECCNAHNPKFKDLGLRNFANAQEFATFVEEAEYDSYKLCTEIFSHGMQTGTWDRPYLNANVILSPKTWMESAKRETNFYNGAKSHFDGYVNFFNQQKLENEHKSKEILRCAQDDRSAQDDTKKNIHR